MTENRAKHFNERMQAVMCARSTICQRFANVNWPTNIKSNSKFILSHLIVPLKMSLLTCEQSIIKNETANPNQKKYIIKPPHTQCAEQKIHLTYHLLVRNL